MVVWGKCGNFALTINQNNIMGNWGHDYFLGCYLDFGSVEDKSAALSVVQSFITEEAQKGNPFAQRVLEYSKGKFCKGDIDDAFRSVLLGDTYSDDLAIMETGEENDNQFLLLSQTNLTKMKHSDIVNEFCLHDLDIQKQLQIAMELPFVSLVRKYAPNTVIKFGAVAVYKEVM